MELIRRWREDARCLYITTPYNAVVVWCAEFKSWWVAVPRLIPPPWLLRFGGVEHVQHAVSDDGIHAVLYLHKYKRFIVPPGW